MNKRLSSHAEVVCFLNRKGRLFSASIRPFPRPGSISPFCCRLLSRKKGAEGNPIAMDRRPLRRINGIRPSNRRCSLQNQREKEMNGCDAIGGQAERRNASFHLIISGKHQGEKIRVPIV
jgi:hypothetical protein